MVDAVPVVAKLITDRAASALKLEKHPLLLPISAPDRRLELARALWAEKTAAVAEVERQRAALQRNRVAQADLLLRGAATAVGASSGVGGGKGGCREALKHMAAAKQLTLAWVRGCGETMTTKEDILDHFFRALAVQTCGLDTCSTECGHMWESCRLQGCECICMVCRLAEICEGFIRTPDR